MWDVLIGDNLYVAAAAGAKLKGLMDKMLAYFRLSLRSDAAVAADHMLELVEINANVSTGAGDYDNTTDSPEALRDNLATAANLALVKAVTDALGSTAAAKLALSAGTIVAGTVDTGSFSATTTAFEADDITEATADHYIGRIIIFTSGALQYQATDITDYELSGSNGKFTVSALTEAPGNNDTFIII